MIKVKADRCSYCGACVGVCPVGAIELAETHLLINEACFDCDLCLAACPVGALRAEDYAETDAAPLRRRHDVVVVGAGPGGSVAAREAAELGLSVLLLEKRQEIGSPVRCAEGVAHELLVPFIEPDPRWISAEASKAQIEVIGDKGAARADWVLGDSILRIHSQVERAYSEPTMIRFQTRGQFTHIYVKELQEFVSSIIENRKPAITGEDGLNVLKVTDAVFRSSNEHKPIVL